MFDSTNWYDSPGWWVRSGPCIWATSKRVNCYCEILCDDWKENVPQEPIYSWENCLMMMIMWFTEEREKIRAVAWIGRAWTSNTDRITLKKTVKWFERIIPWVFELLRSLSDYIGTKHFINLNQLITIK